MVKLPPGDTPPERDARKPFPSEPWRFICPDCGGHVAGNPKSENQWQCHRCDGYYRRKELFDQREEKPVNDVEPTNLP